MLRYELSRIKQLMVVPVYTYHTCICDDVTKRSEKVIRLVAKRGAVLSTIKPLEATVAVLFTKSLAEREYLLEQHKCDINTVSCGQWVIKLTFDNASKTKISYA